MAANPSSWHEIALAGLILSMMGVSANAAAGMNKGRSLRKLTTRCMYGLLQRRRHKSADWVGRAAFVINESPIRTMTPIDDPLGCPPIHCQKKKEKYMPAGPG